MDARVSGRVPRQAAIQGMMSLNPDIAGCEPFHRFCEPNGVTSLKIAKDSPMPTSRSIPIVKKCVLASATLIAALIPCIAAAALGEPEASVQTDVTMFRGSIKTTEHASYRLHEIQLPSGTTLREFAGADGKVFAVAWNGPNVPNLRQTFGRYYDTFVTAAKAKHSGHTHLQIEQPGLVVQSSGHMRAFAGRAYLPQAVPSGVGLGELR
jgi:hypothetical protein